MILRKIIKIVATGCQIFTLKCTKIDVGWGSAPDPAESLQAPQTLSSNKGDLLLREGRGLEGEARGGEEGKGREGRERKKRRKWNGGEAGEGEKGEIRHINPSSLPASLFP